MHKHLRAAILALIVIGIAGCTDLKPYHAEPDRLASLQGGLTPHSKAPAEPNDCNDDARKSCVAFVEYDDFGHLYNRAQLDQTLAYAEKIASRGAQLAPAAKRGEDTPGPQPSTARQVAPVASSRPEAEAPPAGGIIVVYVHGWHHDAHEGDTDLAHFRGAIHTFGVLDQESFHDNRRIMGIYLGWRGESVSLYPVNLLTFWDRKNTAQSVGDGAVFELFRKLAKIREAYPTSRLVIVGHSFGGAVVYSAISHSILDQIITDPAHNDPARIIRTEDLAKRWDLVMLVNPAFEAMQVRPHFEAARSREYAVGQLPHLVMVTSEADWATKDAFPTGRHVSTLFKRYADDLSAAMNTTAIGHYIPYVTHQLEINKAFCDLNPHGRPISATDKLEHVVNAPDYCFGDPRATMEDGSTKVKGEPTRITRCDTPGLCARVAPGHYLQRGPIGIPGSETDPTPQRMPIMNIRTTRSIMTGHNDIWNPTMQSFMVQFLLLSVSKPTDMPLPTTSSIPARRGAGRQANRYAIH